MARGVTAGTAGFVVVFFHVRDLNWKIYLFEENGFCKAIYAKKCSYFYSVGLIFQRILKFFTLSACVRLWLC